MPGTNTGVYMYISLQVGGGGGECGCEKERGSRCQTYTAGTLEMQYYDPPPPE